MVTCELWSLLKVVEARLRLAHTKSSFGPRTPPLVSNSVFALCAVHAEPRLPSARLKSSVTGTLVTVALATVGDCPPTDTVATRAVVVALTATLYDTVPFPLPLAPDVMVSQPALLPAAHAQPVGAVTFTDPAPPAVASVWLFGEIV